MDRMGYLLSAHIATDSYHITRHEEGIYKLEAIIDFRATFEGISINVRRTGITRKGVAIKIKSESIKDGKLKTMLVL